MFIDIIVVSAQGTTRYATPVVSYTSKDGYPAGIVFSIFKDIHGYLWISSGNGLTRFDGFRFEKINEKYNIEGTYFPEIKGFGDKVLISSRTSLFIYDYNSDAITTVKYPDSLMADMMTFYQEYDKKIYIFNLATTKGGPGSGSIYMIYDPDFNTFKKITGLDFGSPVMNVSDNGLLTAISYHGNVYEMQTASSFAHKTKLAETLTCVTYTGNDTWVSIDIKNSSLVKIQKSGNLYNSRKISDWKENAFQSRNNNILLKDSSILFYSDGQTVYRFKNNKVEKFISGQDTYFSLFEDNNGNCWIGGIKGLYLIPFARFTELQFTDSEIKYFYPISGNSSGDLLIPVYGKGIAKLKTQSPGLPNDEGYNYSYTYKHNGGFTPWNIQLSDSNFLFGTDAGFITGDGNNWKHHRMNYPVLLDGEESNDKSGVYLAANRGIEFWSWAKNDTLSPVFPELKGVRVYRFYKDSGKNIWCLSDKGTGIINSGKFVKDSLLSSFKIYDIVEVEKNTYWVSTSKGLFNYKNGKLNRIFEHLIQSGPFDMIITKKNILVMSKGTTLYVIDLNKSGASGRYELYVFNEKNGFMVDDMNRNCFTEDASGRLWIAAMNKIVYCEPENLIRGSLPVVSTIKSLQTDTKIFSFTPDKTSSAIIRLTPGDKRLSFEFSGVALINPGNLFFKYRLIGLSDKWSNITKETFATFLNLIPGSYSFEVCASIDGVNWSEASVTQKIIVQPVWYQTLLFKIVLGLMIIALIFAIHRYRVNQLLQIEKIRNNISSDLHDEIGSTLSSINIYTGLAKKETNKEPLLDSISQNVNDVITKLDDLVWSINPGHDSISSIINRINNYAEPLTGAKGIKLNFEANQQVKTLKLTAETRHHVYLILKELINNSVKHSQCYAITIEIVKEGKQIILIASDDGTGFDKKKITTGRNGLENIKKRTRDLKGFIELESTTGKGTRIKIEIPV
jgi:signal transduction histidine kinase/ligand-binding sensor domain-containing protein